MTVFMFSRVDCVFKNLQDEHKIFIMKSLSVTILTLDYSIGECVGPPKQESECCSE